MFKECVRSIRENTEEGSYEIIVVDNGSTRYQQGLHDSADVYIKNEKNLGYAPAVNQGFAVAKGEYICILNDDTKVGSGWSDRLMESCNDGVSCPMQIDMGNVSPDEYREHVIERLQDENQHSDSVEFGQLDGYGSCYMARAETFRYVAVKGKLLDEGYKMGMFEDRDLWGRIQKAGRKIIRDMRVWIWHAGSATWNELPDRSVLYEANRKRFEKKWGVHPNCIIQDPKPIDREPVVPRHGGLRVAATVIAYNEGRYIIPNLKQYPSEVEKIIVCASTVPWFGSAQETAGEMLTKLQEWRDPRVQVVKKHWKKEHDQRNWGIAMLYDYDWIITLDPDEFFDKAGWEKLLTELESAPADADVVVCNRMTTYWRDHDHIWDEEGTHKPIIAVRPKSAGATYWEKRETIQECRLTAKVEMHHLSWVRSDAEVWAKISNYSHAVDFDIKEWFENVWKNGTPDSFGLMPLKYPKDVKAVRGNLPDELRRLLS